MPSEQNRKWIVVPVIIFGIVFSLYVVGKITGIIQMYHIPTISSEPTIKKGSIIWGTDLKSPQLRLHVMFRHFEPETSANAIYVFRCMGMPGNTIEMQNGSMYVDGVNIDADLQHKRNYKLYSTNPLKYVNLLEDKDELDYFASEETVLELSDLQFQKIKEACAPTNDSIVPFVFPPMEIAAFLWNQNKMWTIDNFGPIKIPPGKYFMLGNNRHNANDSRFWGFVDEVDIVGVKL